MKKRSAFVLAAVFFLMVVFILLTAALFRLVPQEVRWSGDHRRETLAYYTATSGLKHALAWLRQVKLGGGDPFLPAADQPYERATLANPGSFPLRLLPAADRLPTGPDTYFPPNLPELRSKPGRIVLGDNWCAEVHIVPDKRTAPHPFLRGAAGNLPPAYTMVALAFRDYNSNGLCDSGENYAMRCEASMVERTFARYAYFVDSWPDNGSDTPALALLPAMTKALFGGPVHSNDTPVLQVLDANRFWSEASFISPFGDELSFAGDRGTPKVDDSFDGVAYLGGNFRGNDPLQRPYLDADPDEAIDSRYRRLYREGQAAIRRTQSIELPTDWSRLLANAWGVESGREVAPASAASQQVYVNREDLGIVSTGSLRELRLDVVDNQGRSLVFNNNGEVTGTPSLGSQALLLAQQQEVTYLVTETRDILSETVTTETGPYTLTETQYSDTPQAGYSPSTYEETYGSTTVPMQSFMITGYTTVNDPPGGAGPATGGTIRIPEYTSTTVDYRVPLTREATRYVRVDVISGNGPYQVTHQEVTGQEEVLVPRTFVPQDLVITATDEAVRLPMNYLTPNNTSLDDYPVFTGDQSGLEVNVPVGKSLVIRRDRQMGRTYQVELRDQAPNGVVAVWGNVTHLRGVNRGGKTILATGANGTGLGNITLSDHLLHFGLAPGTPPTRGGNSLGIIGNNIFLDSHPTTLARFTAARPLFLHASLFAAGGGFAAANLAGANRVAELRVVGGVLQRSIGTLLEGSRGWSSRYRYDNYLHLEPPPSFPADGRFDLTFFRVTRP
jgi:hypothetical protein